tara:strand:- start:1995 stop:2324 length:330 start_codon:yes stop_codon:yes gene_type:complete
MFLRKKYKKCKEDVVKSVLDAGIKTCCLKIELTAVSKIEGYFIYEVCYLDQGKIKSVPIIARNIVDIVEKIEPYINKGIPEQTVSFALGMSEDVVESRMKSKTFKSSKK